MENPQFHQWLRTQLVPLGQHANVLGAWAAEQSPEPSGLKEGIREQVNVVMRHYLNDEKWYSSKDRDFKKAVGEMLEHLCPLINMLDENLTPNVPEFPPEIRNHYEACWYQLHNIEYNARECQYIKKAPKEYLPHPFVRQTEYLNDALDKSLAAILAGLEDLNAPRKEIVAAHFDIPENLRDTLSCFRKQEYDALCAMEETVTLWETVSHTLLPLTKEFVKNERDRCTEGNGRLQLREHWENVAQVLSEFGKSLAHFAPDKERAETTLRWFDYSAILPKALNKILSPRIKAIASYVSENGNNGNECEKVAGRLWKLSETLQYRSPTQENLETLELELRTAAAAVRKKGVPNIKGLEELREVVKKELGTHATNRRLH